MPDVVEITAYGMEAFKAGKTRFAGRPVERPDVDPNTLGLRMSPAERDKLIALRPDVYYLTEHYVNYPAVLVRLSVIRRDELREALGIAWRYAMERQRPAKKKKKSGKTTPRRRGVRR
ncbi:MAG: MmcQ/YjbR family DNA-binding protein [Gammaproteobacteria bacterium]